MKDLYLRQTESTEADEKYFWVVYEKKAEAIADMEEGDELYKVL